MDLLVGGRLGSLGMERSEDVIIVAGSIRDFFRGGAVVRELRLVRGFRSSG